MRGKERKRKKMKRTIMIAVVMVLALSMAISGTIAYLSDTDSDVNVMTLGNVKIEQVELQRKDGIDYKNGGVIADGDELEPFEQGKPLYPAYYSNDISNYTAKTPNDEQFWWGPYVTADVTGNGASNGLWDDKLVGALDKFVFVKNTGKSDCYYRTWLAFECPEGMEYSEGTNKEFMMNINLNDRFKWETHDYCTIEGVRYLVMSATYQNVLAAGEISRPSLLQVVMTHNATNEDMELLGDTYEILAFTQAVQTINMPEDPTEALNAAFGSNYPWKDGDVENNMPIIINSEEEFKAALEELTDAGSGSNTIHLAKDMDLSDIEWTPIKVDGYHGADIITVEGNGHVIKGLKAPLFAGGFAGGSGIVIKNLTIADSNIVSTNTIGSGAFIESVDSMTTITLQNCHLKNSTVTGGDGSRTGGLIGWTAGYNNVNDGPVKTYVTIEDCSVIGSTITCNGSVGGIYGHAGNNAWTYSTVKNCTVKDCTLNSTDDGDWRVGVVVGTANVGEMTIEGITESGNTLTQTGKTAPAGQSNLYGRFVPNSTGKLVIDGVEIK